MSNKLIDYQAKLNKEYALLKEVIQDYVEQHVEIKEAVSRIDDFYNTKLAEVKPHIMVYGIYNAGKSSIINELLGKDKAIVSDKPTTDRVYYYEWKGYQIADTPGVGAPIEHEYVTNEHLKKADVVIFVMSTTGSNEKAENYTRMKDIADAGKKIIIVLNDKNGDLGNNDSNIQTIKAKVAENMKSIGIQNVDERYCVVVINAARAKKGRLENKQVLLKRSNIIELEKIILSELKNTDGFTIIRNTIFEIEKNLESIIVTLEKNNNDREMRIVNNILMSLRERKTNIRRDIADYIKQKTSQLGKVLPDMIWAHKDNQDAINEVVQKQIDKIVQSVKDEMEQYIEEMQDVLAVDIRNLAEILNNIKLSHRVKEIDVNSKGNSAIDVVEKNVKTGSSKENINKLISLSMEMLDNYNKNKHSLILPKSIDICNKEHLVNIPIVKEERPISEALTEMMATKLAKTNVEKCLLETAIGKNLAKFVPVIGEFMIAYEMISFVKKLFGNDTKEIEEAEARNDYERKRAEVEAQAQQELHQKCLYMADDLADDLIKTMNDIINDIVGEFEAIFIDKIQNSTEDENKKVQTLMVLRAISNEYNDLYCQLGGNK